MLVKPGSCQEGHLTDHVLPHLLCKSYDSCIGLMTSLSKTERFEKNRSHRKGGWSGVCVFYVCIFGLVMISIGLDKMGPGGTKEYLKVPNSTSKYPEVQGVSRKN